MRRTKNTVSEKSSSVFYRALPLMHLSRCFHFLGMMPCLLGKVFIANNSLEGANAWIGNVIVHNLGPRFVRMKIHVVLRRNGCNFG